MKVKVMVLCAAMLLSFAAVCNAEGQAQSMPAMGGQVVSIENGVIGIQSERGETAGFLIDADTVVRIGDRVGSLSDVKPGIRAKVSFQPNFVGTRMAKIIQIPGTQPEPKPVVIEGTVVEIGQAALSVRNGKGETTTFAVTADTRVMIGDRPAGFGDVKVGIRVAVGFMVMQDGTKWAKGIKILTGAAPPPPPAGDLAGGLVTAVSSSSISVQTEHRGVLTFAVTGDTIVRMADRNISIGDVQVGYRVQVKFVTTDGGVLVARGILVMPQTGTR